MQASTHKRKRCVRARPNAYRKVFDSRKRRVRGLWQRNGKYFANLTVKDELGRPSSQWVPLGATNLTEAIDDYRTGGHHRADPGPQAGRSHVRGAPPLFRREA